MIVGEFTNGDRAVIPIALLADDGQETEIEAAIDTGFMGALLLPQSMIRRSRLPHLDDELVLLADGTLTRLALHEVTVVWGGERRTVAAHAADSTPLVGIEMLRGSVGTFEFFEGGSVTIEVAE
uniref:Clan AA aspartic protease n=1 Tax=uncultured Armatimonadetes bacterium TaxID=157466 RepID=A0A6J4H0W4_9BACT|nr:hypothetical protein AVDCRST_MAG63-20 [uncultured Armatimonadetes bacterium]